MYPNFQHRPQRAIAVTFTASAMTVELTLLLAIILLATLTMIGCSDTSRDDSRLAQTAFVTVPATGKIAAAYT